MKMSKIVMGVDPGSAGGIVLIDEQGIIVDMYTMPKNGSDVDYRMLSEIFSKYKNDNITVGIEEVHAIFGASAKATFNFGYIYGFLNALLVANGIRYINIPPKKWQKYIWTNNDIVFKINGKKTTNTKATSLNAAGRLFPKESFRATKKSTTPHDGLVDAALIAYYTLKNY